MPRPDERSASIAVGGVALATEAALVERPVIVRAREDVTPN